MIARWFVRLPTREAADRLTAELAAAGFAQERLDADGDDGCYVSFFRRFASPGSFDPAEATRRISKLADREGGCLDGYVPQIER
jgi:hypothetical protein